MLEEAILAVQDAAQILTEVIMVNPLAALGGAMVDGDEDPTESES